MTRRMYSSRMRTVRSSSHVYNSMHWALCMRACTGQGGQYLCIPAYTGQGCVYPSMHCLGVSAYGVSAQGGWGVCPGWVGCLLRGGWVVSAWGGWGVCLRGVCLRGVCLGVSAKGRCLPRGDFCPGGVCPRGVCSGGCIPVCTEADTPPVDRMTDRCKNITFANYVCER